MPYAVLPGASSSSTTTLKPNLKIVKIASFSSNKGQMKTTDQKDLYRPSLTVKRIGRWLV